MVALYQQGFPQIGVPVVDPNTGILQQAWYQFLVNLWNRTGGGGGLSPTPIIPVIPTAAPFTYTATTTGNMWVDQGTYADVSIIRGGVTLLSGKITRGIFPLSLGDDFTINYTTLTPTLHFIPL